MISNVHKVSGRSVSVYRDTRAKHSSVFTGRPISGCTCGHHNMYDILKGWQLPNGF